MARFWIPKFFFKKYDGGPTSKVTGYWLIEWKAGFSIVLLKVEPGTTERFHTHAFRAISWYIRGKCEEEHLSGIRRPWHFKRGPKYTGTDAFHRVQSEEGGWILSVRGPWTRDWKEWEDGKVTHFKNGRVVTKQEEMGRFLAWEMHLNPGMTMDEVLTS